MKDKLLIAFLILLAFRVCYAQQTDSLSFLNFDYFPEFNTGLSKSLNLKDNTMFFDVDGYFKLNEIKNQSASPVFKQNYKKELRSIIDSVKYHRYLPEYFSKSNMLIPLAEVNGVNIVFLLHNRFITNQPYAKISFETVKHNLDTGFVWDEDTFHNNQLRHPYQGALHFNAARSNGYSFWESAPFVFAGSLAWEIFMEKDPPQANDLITSFIGGVLEGEMGHRMSSLVLDESTSGIERIFRELAGACLNPVRGVNRLFRGELFRKTPLNVNDVFPAHSRINFGYAGVSPDDKNGYYEKSHIMLEYVFTYGKRFDYPDVKPLEFFKMRFGTDFKKNEKPSFWHHTYGILYGKNLSMKSDSRFVLGAFIDHDYAYSDFHRMGAQSLGLGLIHLSPPGKKWTTFISLHSNFIVLGAINSIFRRGPSRDYDYVIGNKTMLETEFTYGPASLGLEYRYYIMKTFEGFPGYCHLSYINPKLFVDISNGFGIGAEYIFYRKFGTYKNHSDYDERSGEYRFYISGSF